MNCLLDVSFTNISPFIEDTNSWRNKNNLAPVHTSKTFQPNLVSSLSRHVNQKKSWSRRKTRVLWQRTLISNLSQHSIKADVGSAGIKRETTQIWCASRYIILCMYYLHSTYSSHRSLLCLTSRGFRTPSEPEAKAGHNLKPSRPLNANQAVWFIEMGSVDCTVSHWRVRRSALSLRVRNSTHESFLNWCESSGNYQRRKLDKPSAEQMKISTC